MVKHPEWVMHPKDLPLWQAPDGSRKVNMMVGPQTCGAEEISAGLWWLAPGNQSEADVHPEAAEIYYVVSGQGRLVMDEDEFEVSQGMAVYIPAGVKHQSFNTGEEDLCYFYAFAPPPPGTSKQEEQGWIRIQ